MLPGEAPIIRAGTHWTMDFRGENDLVSGHKFSDGSPQDFLAQSARIHVGSIKEVDPQFQRLSDQWTAVLFRQDPLIPTPRAEGHRPKANLRYFQPGLSKVYVFHRRFFCPGLRSRAPEAQKLQQTPQVPSASTAFILDEHLTSRGRDVSSAADRIKRRTPQYSPNR